MVKCHDLFLFCVHLEVVVPFVDIGGIVDHHCLNFLSIIKNKNEIEIKYWQ